MGGMLRVDSQATLAATNVAQQDWIGGVAPPR